MQPFFSVLVVCLNPGEKLQATLESIKKQSFQNYEVIIKDGFSSDGSLACVNRVLPGAMIVQEKDTGIYDAMNQAAAKASGRYVYYLNCGDWFYSETVLEEMAGFIRESRAYREGTPGIYYGNIFERQTGQQVPSNPKIDAFGCYRNVPCHQACFYSRELLMAHPFENGYKVRADYEQFLWCFFVGGKEKNVIFSYKDMIVTDYEGGGFSETKENRKVSAAEHKEITQKYMTGAQRLKYKTALLLTLAPLRTCLAENEKTAGVYNRLKERLYTRKG
jgi:glycosyltransferase involved in cell wall biosynthesis